MNRLWVSVPVLLVMLSVRAAHGDDVTQSAEDGGERRAPAEATPVGATPTPVPPCKRSLAVRAAAAGTYFHLFDVTLWGGGTEVSFVAVPCGKPPLPDASSCSAGCG
jgi:hypothetical protein